MKLFFLALLRGGKFFLFVSFAFSMPLPEVLTAPRTVHYYRERAAPR